jgi:hypothetical protein
MDKKKLYASMRHFDSDVKWSASRVLLNEFLKGRKVPASVIGMAFNIINGRAFDPAEDQKVRNLSQGDIDRAIDAGIEQAVTIEDVILDLDDKEPLVRIIAIENLVIACEYGSDISKAAPALEKTLKDKDLGVRRNAAFAFLIMSEHGYDLSGGRNALEEAQKDKDEKVKEYVKKVIGNFQKVR